MCETWFCCPLTMKLQSIIKNMNLEFMSTQSKQLNCEWWHPSSAVSPDDVQSQLWPVVQSPSFFFFFPEFVSCQMWLTLCTSSHTQTQQFRNKQARTSAKCLLPNIPASSVWFETVTESKSPCDEHHPKKFQIRSVTKLLLWLTLMINGRACTSGQSCLFMKWTVKRPSWLWYCETKREREREPYSTILQIRIPAMWSRYHMPRFSVGAAYTDGELHRTVNTGLHSQFKYTIIKGEPVSPIFCVDSRSRQRTSAQTPGPSQLPSKHFPSQRSNHLPSDRPLGAQIQGQVQSRGARGGREGMEGEKERKRKERWSKKKKKEEKWDSKGARGWVWRGGVRQAGVSKRWGRGVAAKV